MSTLKIKRIPCNMRARKPPVLFGVRMVDTAGMPLHEAPTGHSFKLSIGKFDLSVYWSEGFIGECVGWHWGVGYGPALCGSAPAREGEFATAQEAADHLEARLNQLLGGLTELAKP